MPAMPRLPTIAPGLRIGLLGGSFNPPHAGHRHIAMMALKRLELDRIWLLVTPGNPLKDNTDLPDLKARLDAVRRVVAHPAVDVTGVEEGLGSARTVDTLSYLSQRLTDVRPVWIMGADNLTGFHRWARWRDIAASMPIAVIDRPGYTFAAMASPAAHALWRYRLDESDAPLLASRAPPAWVFLHGPRSPLSSTELRRSQMVPAVRGY